MIRIPLKQNRVTQTKAAGMPKTPPAATTNPVIPTSTNAPDSTEARRDRQAQTSPDQRKPLTLVEICVTVALAFMVVFGLPRCTPAHAGSVPVLVTNEGGEKPSASNGIITTGADFPCLVLENTISKASQPPPLSGATLTPNIKAGSGTTTPSRHGYGQGAVFREDAGVTLLAFSTPCPPLALENATGGFITCTED